MYNFVLSPLSLHSCSLYEWTFPSLLLPSTYCGCQSSQCCSLPSAPLVNGAGEQYLGWGCAHQLNRVFWGLCQKAPLYSQCCGTADVKPGHPDQGGHLSCFIHCSLSVPKGKVTPKRHQRKILGVQHHWAQVLGSEEQQRVHLGRTTALAEWFPQGLVGSAGGIRISFVPDVSVSLWLLPENKEIFISFYQEIFISTLKPLFPYKSLFFFSYWAASHFSVALFKESSTAKSKPATVKQTTPPKPHLPKKWMSLFCR